MTTTFATSESLDKLMPDFLAAKDELRPAGKSGYNNHDRYNYAQEIDWYSAIAPVLTRHGLVVLFSCSTLQPSEKRTTRNGGTEYHCYVSGAARLLHKSGQWIEVHGWGEGQDRADKGVYKAETGLKKYLYSLLLALPTNDDPERDETVGLSDKPASRKPQARNSAQASAYELALKAINSCSEPARLEGYKNLAQQRRQEGKIDEHEHRMLIEAIKHRADQLLVPA